MYLLVVSSPAREVGAMHGAEMTCPRAEGMGPFGVAIEFGRNLLSSKGQMLAPLSSYLGSRDVRCIGRETTFCQPLIHVGVYEADRGGEREIGKNFGCVPMAEFAQNSRFNCVVSGSLGVFV